MTSQDADERRIRSLLVRMGVGPDAQPIPAPTDELEPPADDEPSDAWWDELYADEEPPTPEPERRPSPRLPNWWEKKPEHLAEPDAEQPEQDAEQAENTPANTAPTSPNSTPEPAEQAPQPAPRQATEPRRPQQSLLDAWDGIRPRTRWLLYHATAAGLGWGFGLVGWSTQVTAWIAADRWTDPQSIACYALGLGGIALYRRTRGWWWPLAWVTAVPVSSTLLGVLLYAPNA